MTPPLPRHPAARPLPARRSRFGAALMALGLLLGGSPALAGTSGGAGTLLMQTGGGTGLGSGDYVSSAAGLGTYYSYFIEVPPGTGNLTVDIFDLDVGGSHDQFFGGANTFTTLLLLDPNGAGAPITVPPGAGLDDAWLQINAISNPMPGHWELRVDTSAGGTNHQGYGVRAHDGDATGGGRELNVYAESFLPLGVVGGTSTSGRFHPYVTSGCAAQSNNFDWDGSPSPGLSYSSVDPLPGSGPSARYTTGALPTSTVDGTWLNQTFGGWTRDASAEDYGIWSLDYDLVAPGPAQGNSGVVYVGAFDAAAPPPGAQPEPSTLRIYFPSDGGAPPVKPQLGQGIIDIVSGVDPPQNNLDTVLRLAVTINNPTPYPITFAAPADVVSVLVPTVTGNRVEYAGNAAATQGGVLAQPAVGGTGTITWDPGIVPAGGWAQLEYDLLIRPQPVSTRTPITGTPAAGGTTATYVDETCTGAACSAQALARATHTLGPLCELAVVTGQSLATQAVIGDLRAYAAGRGTVVEWTTLSEHGTVGFHLQRLDPESGEYVRVNDRLLPGLLHAPQGGTYRYRDPGARAGELHTYRLVELEADGGRREYGPFPVIVAPRARRASAAAGGGGDRPLADYARIPRAASAHQRARRAALRAAGETARLARRLRRGTRVKIGVRTPGLYFLDAADLGEVLGIPTAVVRRLIRTGQLALTNRGEAVATAAAANHGGLYFYGEAVGPGETGDESKGRRDDLYTDLNVYRLGRGPGLAMGVVDGGRPAPVMAPPFRETLLAEGNKYVLTHLFDDPDGDYWMWDFRMGGLALPDCGAVMPPQPCYVSAYPLPSPDPVAAGDAEAILTVRLHGGTAARHRVSVTLNGEVLGDTAWDGTVAHSARLAFPAGLLRDAGNRVGIEAAPAPGAGMPSVVYVNDLSLEYPRAPRARDGAVLIPAVGARTLTVGGFGGGNPWVLDLARSKRPARVVNATVDGRPGERRVSFRSAAPARPYLVVDPATARPPVEMIADAPSNLRARRHRVDYLIITGGEMVSAAELLAGHRRAQGLRTMVVDVEDIYDEFNHGIQNAEAIWRFLRYAHLSWSQGPRFVVFAGEGSYDYKNYLGHGDAIVPTLLVATPQGLFPSDNLLVDVLGDDRLPEMAAGRIPAISAEELRAVASKIIAYEHGALDARDKRAIVAADAPDGGGDFPSDSERLAAVFPGDYDVERLHLDSVDLDSARRRLVEALNEGRTFMNFIGHGGTMAIGNRGLMTIADLDTLDNGDRLPVVTVQTCLAGQFGFPGIDGIGELLVLRPDRGAVAVWAPSGLSMNNQARFLGEEFYRASFEGGETILGESIRAAQRRFVDDGYAPYLLDIYNLIGDPATVMR